MPSIIEENQYRQRLENLRASGNSPEETRKNTGFEPKNDNILSSKKSIANPNSIATKTAFPKDNPTSALTLPKNKEQTQPNKFTQKTPLPQIPQSDTLSKRPRSFERINRLDPRILTQRSIKIATSPFSLIGAIDISRDIFFVFALIAAILKDISDITLGLIPGIGLLLAFVFGLMTSIVIIVCVLVTGSFRLKSSIKKWLTIGGANLTEMLFGTNFLPIETISVFILFFLTLIERIEEKNEQETNKKIELAESTT